MRIQNSKRDRALSSGIALPHQSTSQYRYVAIATNPCGLPSIDRQPNAAPISAWKLSSNCNMPAAPICRFFQSEFGRLRSPLFEKRDAHGLLHCTNGPAVVFEDGAEEWWNHGRVHRTCGPAISFKQSNMVVIKCTAPYVSHGLVRKFHVPHSHVWCQNGLLHRADGPAVTNALGKGVEWWVNGRPHRDNGPAVIKSEQGFWFQHGLLHRSDGPAFIDGRNQFWYWNGTAYTNASGVNKRFRTDGVPAEFFLNAMLLSDDSVSAQISKHPSTVAEIRKVLPTIENIILTTDGLGWSAVKSHIKSLIDGKSHRCNPLENFDTSMLLPDVGN